MQRTRTRPVILLIEDYADSRQMLALLLESLDFRVLPAANGKEALAAAANNPIDLVLTDFNLPDMTGPTLVRNLRRVGNQLAHTPVIMLTASDGYEYRLLAAEAGCDAFLVKPPDFEFLKQTIDRLLPIERSTQLNSLRGSRNVKVDPVPTSL
jgi:CheY-like chemotaxis protein